MSVHVVNPRRDPLGSFFDWCVPFHSPLEWSWFVDINLSGIELLHDQHLLLSEQFRHGSTQASDPPHECLVSEFPTLVASFLSHKRCVVVHVHGQETVVIVGGHEDMPWLVCSAVLRLPTFFPKAILPAGDHTEFFQEETRVLQSCPNVSVFALGGDVMYTCGYGVSKKSQQSVSF